MQKYINWGRKAVCEEKSHKLMHFCTFAGALKVSPLRPEGYLIQLTGLLRLAVLDLILS